MDICATQGSFCRWWLRLSKWRSSNSTESGCHLLSPGVINTFWTNIHHHPTRDTYVTCTTMPINPPFEEFPLYSCQKNNRKWTNIHKRLQTIETMVKPVKTITYQMFHCFKCGAFTNHVELPSPEPWQEVGLSKTNPPVESRIPTPKRCWNVRTLDRRAAKIPIR